MTREEENIRYELRQLTTYRIPNSNTDLVALKSVERVLNLVFRGHRDLESKTVSEQVKWERDIAIQQLQELGYGLGEKMQQEPKMESEE